MRELDILSVRLPSTLCLRMWRWFLICFELTRFNFDERKRKQSSVLVLIFKLITNVWSQTRNAMRSSVACSLFFDLFVDLLHGQFYSEFKVISNSLKNMDFIPFAFQFERQHWMFVVTKQQKRTISCQCNKSRGKSSWSFYPALSSSCQWRTTARVLCWFTCI